MPSALALRYARHHSFCSLHTSQSFLSPSNHVRIAHEILPFTRLAPALLISVARAAVANAKHMICLSSATRAAFAALLVPPCLLFYDDREHVIQTLVLDNN